MSSTLYIGLDLAWSERNQSGAAVLCGGPNGAELVEPPALLGELKRIADYVSGHAGAGPAILAVDAPLLVPNPSGRRPAEAALAAAFRKHEAGAHPANRALLDRAGTGVRGEELLKKLARLPSGPFQAVDRISPGQPGRLVTEVYPHAAMVALFNLPRTLKYKARGSRRSRAERLEAWQSYQAHLRGLATADPPLRGHQGLLEVDVEALRGAALKGYEDRVDALMCAYIALYAHRWGEERCVTFGDMQGGWILTPSLPAQDRLV